MFGGQDEIKSGIVLTAIEAMPQREIITSFKAAAVIRSEESVSAQHLKIKKRTIF